MEEIEESVRRKSGPQTEGQVVEGRQAEDDSVVGRALGHVTSAPGGGPGRGRPRPFAGPRSALI